jgi:hypothetical protein
MYTVGVTGSYVVEPALNRKTEKCAIDDFVSLLFVMVIFPLFKTVELHLSGLIRTASHPDTQKNPDNWILL